MVHQILELLFSIKVLTNITQIVGVAGRKSQGYFGIVDVWNIMCYLGQKFWMVHHGGVELSVLFFCQVEIYLHNPLEVFQLVWFPYFPYCLHERVVCKPHARYPPLILIWPIPFIFKSSG